MTISESFWKGKRIFLTGNTGFKGSWLSIWLDMLGAEVYGYALDPPTNPSLFELAGVKAITKTTIGDIRNRELLASTLRSANADIVFHMAAQALVRDSYADPLGTYETNAMGTANLLEAVRSSPSVKAVVIVTTDKCYENKEWDWGYREADVLGGYDPYSSSKACAEIITAAYRKSFFSSSEGRPTATLIATARAGNVIGGGDWAKDRLIPDFIRSFEASKTVRIRNPMAIRPWQHVLEPLSGYLLLAQALFEGKNECAEAWNFGPDDSDARPVQWIVGRLCSLWEGSKGFEIDKGPHPHEAGYLKLDCSKAKNRLGWRQSWDLDTALRYIIAWNKNLLSGVNVLNTTRSQIDEYMKASRQNS